MKKNLVFAASAAWLTFLVGCATPLPPGAERGPDGTMAYEVLVEASAPDVRIEVNGELVGTAPIKLKIFGDRDGTFHDFGSDYYEVRALPSGTNQYVQSRLFQTGRFFTPQDQIPQHIYFSMNQAPPAYVPYPVYVQPPPTYYYEPYYSRPYYYGPSFRFDIGPRFHGGPGFHHHR